MTALVARIPAWLVTGILWCLSLGLLLAPDVPRRLGVPVVLVSRAAGGRESVAFGWGMLALFVVPVVAGMALTAWQVRWHLRRRPRTLSG